MALTSAPELPPTLDIPAIWCPLPHRVHPEAEGADDRLLDWAKRFDVVRNDAAVKRFYAAGFGQFCAETYPRAVRLDLMSEWNAYNWVVDDLLDEGHTALSYDERVRMCRELMAQMPPDMHAPRAESPLFAAMADLWERAARPMSLAWRKRFVAHYRDWLTSSLLPATPSDRAQLSSFTRRRRIHSGCEMSFDLIETGNLSEVPELVTNCDTYETVRAAASDAICWTNDVYSIRKEIARGDYDHLVAFLRGAEHREWDEALDEALRMIEEATRDFLLAREDLRRLRPLFELSDEEWGRVEESLSDLGDWVSGSLHWHTWSPRYHVVDTTPAGRTPGYIEDHLL
jgi:hypothetical protein